MLRKRSSTSGNSCKTVCVRTSRYLILNHFFCCPRERVVLSPSRWRVDLTDTPPHAARAVHEQLRHQLKEHQARTAAMHEETDQLRSRAAEEVDSLRARLADSEQKMARVRNQAHEITERQQREFAALQEEATRRMRALQTTVWCSLHPVALPLRDVFIVRSCFIVCLI